MSQPPHPAGTGTGEAAPLLASQSQSHSDDTASTLGPASSLRSLSPQRSRATAAAAAAAARNLSFASAVASALCAGSVAVFSLYGHIFQERLHYTQFQVNGVAIAASIACYIPVPFLGYLCDRVGPAPLSLLSAAFFGGGYGLAAALYKRAAAAAATSTSLQTTAQQHPPERWAYAAMIFAFVCVGIGTSSMYLSAVATCAKNFGRGRHRGLALAVPIAAYGLSGMWLSQVGSRVFYEAPSPDGSTRGDVDVFRFFLFLAILLVVVGVLGAFGLRIVDENDLIEDAVGELERSGILDSSSAPLLNTPGRTERGYGATTDQISERRDHHPFEDEEGGDKDDDDEQERARKTWVLNAETQRFLTDHTMWCFALGFLFMIGPGEAFINNLGTVIKTLYPPEELHHHVGRRPTTSAATHVSIVGITSTVVRLLTGSLTDLLAPSPQAQHIQLLTSSTASSLQRRQQQKKRFTLSRVTFLLFFAFLLSLGLATLASGAIQDHGDRFWIVSGLIGSGYGAVFSLTPIIITVIWGVENFATNWGIVAMFPALGATMWGLIYSAVYQSGADRSAGSDDRQDNLCYGSQCYASTFWAMAASVWVACALVLWAWKGKNGWAQRGIVV